MWLSWQSGRFRYQRSAVRIQTLTNFYRTFIIYCQLYCVEKAKINGKKRPGMVHFLRICKRIGNGTLVRVRPCLSYTNQDRSYFIHSHLQLRYTWGTFNNKVIIGRNMYMPCYGYRMSLVTKRSWVRISIHTMWIFYIYLL